MPFVSVTRLRLRSVRFLPAFVVHALRTTAQVRRAPGFLGGSLLADRHWTFWTVTAWQSGQSMRDYMLGGSHRAAMPFLGVWCDEAAVVHWEQDDEALPTWPEADRRLRLAGRPSKLRFPSPDHDGLAHASPRIGRSGAIRPLRRQASAAPARSS